MVIDIDIYHAVDSRDRVCLYHPTVHWMLNEQDTVTPATMRKLAKTIEDAINTTLKAELEVNEMLAKNGCKASEA